MPLTRLELHIYLQTRIPGKHHTREILQAEAVCFRFLLEFEAPAVSALEERHDLALGDVPQLEECGAEPRVR